MKNLTLVIPAKYESDSLPKVLEEIKGYDCEVIIVLEFSDTETINVARNYDCKILYQSKKGYGNALIEGMNNVQTEYLCIFNADGSFEPKHLRLMIDICKNFDFIFATRYKKNAGSDDDTFLTRIGNFFFTLFGRIFFSLKISDILYTYVLGKTSAFKEVNLKSENFNICVELPIKAQRKNMAYTDFASKERSRIAGFKKVNEFRDGFKILFYMLALLFSRKDK